MLAVCVHSSIPPLTLLPTHHLHIHLTLSYLSPPPPAKLWVRYSTVAGGIGKKNPSSCPQGAHRVFSKEDLWLIFPQLYILSLEDLLLCYIYLGINSSFAKGQTGK